MRYVTTTTYDAAGRVVNVQDALGNVTTTSYDVVGRVERLINPRGAVKTLSYDDASRNTREQDPLGRVMTMSYDAIGALKSKQDARNVRCTYTYDYTYDDLGQRTAMATPTGRLTYTYDNAGRLSVLRNQESELTTYTTRAELGKSGSCHLFRHAMTTAMHDNGADMRFLQEMLGHVKLDTTQLYTRVSVQQLKRIHDQTHPAEPPPPAAE